MQSTHLESSTSLEESAESKKLPTWLKVGAVAAASALAGGLAAAWFYRGTLKRLRNPEFDEGNSNFRITSPHGDEEI